MCVLFLITYHANSEFKMAAMQRTFGGRFMILMISLFFALNSCTQNCPVYLCSQYIHWLHFKPVSKLKS